MPTLATFIVGMLCMYLLCFAAMFWLISTRLEGDRLGMDVFAAGNAMLGLVYVLQLAGGPPDWSLLNLLNHSLTLCVPLVYVVGGMRFFGRPTGLLKPLLLWALAYTGAQLLVQWLAGTAARYVLLALTSALVFFVMTLAVLRVSRSLARELRVEMWLFALLIGGLGLFNLAKARLVAQGGLPALDMGQPFHVWFYVYMSFLATVLPPMMIWLVLRRLTDALRDAAGRDPLTQLLNRRGLLTALQGHFRARQARPARQLMLDIDHFKRINDCHGHQAGDLALRQVAQVLRQTLRQGDLACRSGGEEFVIVCTDAEEAGVLALAERLRAAIEAQAMACPDAAAPLRCTVTLGISQAFHSLAELDAALQQADAALYRGKEAGRNRVEPASLKP